MWDSDLGGPKLAEKTTEITSKREKVKGGTAMRLKGAAAIVCLSTSLVRAEGCSCAPTVAADCRANVTMGHEVVLQFFTTPNLQ